MATELNVYANDCTHNSYAEDYTHNATFAEGAALTSAHSTASTVAILFYQRQFDYRDPTHNRSMARLHKGGQKSR